MSLTHWMENCNRKCEMSGFFCHMFRSRCPSIQADDLSQRLPANCSVCLSTASTHLDRKGGGVPWMLAKYYHWQVKRGPGHITWGDHTTVLLAAKITGFSNRTAAALFCKLWSITGGLHVVNPCRHIAARLRCVLRWPKDDLEITVRY